MSLESGKKYGFIASMINVIGPIVSLSLFFGLIFYSILRIRAASSIPFFGGSVFTVALIAFAIAEIIGLILFFLAMYNLSHYYNEPSIFNRVLYGFILTIVSGIIAVGTVFAFTATLATNSAQAITTTATISPLIAQFLIGFFVVILVTFIVWIINAFLYWQAFNKLGERSGVDAFKTAGVLFIIGAVLTVVAVGIIITWVAWIYAALGYRRLNPQPLPAPIATSTPPPLGTSRIYCQNCGTENQAYAVYCGNCGKPLTPNQTSV